MSKRNLVRVLLILFVVGVLAGCDNATPTPIPTNTLEPTEEPTPTEELTPEPTEEPAEEVTEEAEDVEEAEPAEPLPDDFEDNGVDVWQGDLWTQEAASPGYDGSAGALKGFCDENCRAGQDSLYRMVGEVPEDALGISFAWKLSLENMSLWVVLSVEGRSYTARVRPGGEEWTLTALKWEDFLYGSNQAYEPSLGLDKLEFRVGQGMLGDATLWLDDIQFVTDAAAFE